MSPTDYWLLSLRNNYTTNRTFDILYGTDTHTAHSAPARENSLLKFTAFFNPCFQCVSSDSHVHRHMSADTPSTFGSIYLEHDKATLIQAHPDWFVLTPSSRNIHASYKQYNE